MKKLIGVAAVIYFLIGIENFFWAAINAMHPGYSIEGVIGRDLLLGIIFVSIGIATFLLTFIENKETLRKVAFGVFLIALFICATLQWERFSIKGNLLKPPFFAGVLVMLIVMHDSLISFILLIVIFFRYFIKARN